MPTNPAPWEPLKNQMIAVSKWWLELGSGLVEGGGDDFQMLKRFVFLAACAANIKTNPGAWKAILRHRKCNGSRETMVAGCEIVENRNHPRLLLTFRLQWLVGTLCVPGPRKMHLCALSLNQRFRRCLTVQLGLLLLTGFLQ